MMSAPRGRFAPALAITQGDPGRNAVEGQPKEPPAMHENLPRDLRRNELVDCSGADARLGAGKRA